MSPLAHECPWGSPGAASVPGRDRAGMSPADNLGALGREVMLLEIESSVIFK